MRTSITSQLFFNECRIPVSNILPWADEGLKSALRCLNEARYGIAWGALGAAHACYDEIMPFVTKRTQFGRPIGSFGKQRMRIARMAQEISNMQLQCMKLGTCAKDRGLDAIAHLVSEAKGHNTTKALKIAFNACLMLGANHIARLNFILRVISEI